MVMRRKTKVHADNPIQGVSQQVPSKRTPNHFEEQINLRPAAVEGDTKRPSLRYLSGLDINTPEDAAFHSYLRGDGEEYNIVIEDSQVKVFDRLTGVEYPVNDLSTGYPQHYTGRYLSPRDGMTYREAFRFLTLADSTFICNTGAVTFPQYLLGVSDSSSTLIYVTQGDYGTRYKIYLDGSVVADYTTGDSDPVTTSTELIAQRLQEDLLTSTAFTTAFSVVRFGSVLHITPVGSTSATGNFTVTDSLGSKAIKAVTGRVQRFEELPPRAPDGYFVQVTQSSGTDTDDYYVKFRSFDPSVSNGAGVWEETVSPDADATFDERTMPHVLKRLADGTFEFGPVVWDKRTKGDEDSNPYPTFINKTINGMYFFENRLSFFSGANICTSRTGDYFNFFRGSARTRLDTDPIDITATASKSLTIRYAFPFDDRLILFADTAQLVSQASGKYTYETASLKVSSEYPVDTRTPPVVVGKSIFYVAPLSHWSSVMELQASESGEDKTFAVPVSDHVPRYIPSQPYQMIGSSSMNSVLLIPTDPAERTLYVYDYMWRDRSRVMSAWHKYILGGDAKVWAGDFYGDEMRLIASYEGSQYLTSMVFDETGSWANETADAHLDLAAQGAIVYDPVSDTSEITFPLSWSNPSLVGRRPGSSHVYDLNASAVVDIPGQPSVYEVVGEVEEALGGTPFEMSFTLSKPYPIKYGPRGEVIPDEETRLQITRLSFNITDTGPFEVITKHVNRADNEDRYTGRNLGGRHYVIGSAPIASGVFVTKPKAQNVDIEITVKSTEWTPFCMTSFEWSGHKMGRLK